MAKWRPAGRIPVPTLGPDDEVWHYTDVDGLYGMVRGGAFWASAAMSLNDTSELDYGFRILNEAWSAIEGTYSDEHRRVADAALQLSTGQFWAEDTYILSASLSGDSLNQWMHYANGSGYAVRIDSQQRLTRLTGTTAAGRVSELSGWRRVVYGEEEGRAKSTEFLQTMATLGEGSIALFGSLSSFALMWASFLKPAAFADEREVRYVFGESSERQFRVSRGRIMSYIEATGPNSMLPIVNVKCGPGADGRIVRSTKTFLASHGYRAEVSTSSIPYSR